MALVCLKKAVSHEHLLDGEGASWPGIQSDQLAAGWAPPGVTGPASVLEINCDRNGALRIDEGQWEAAGDEAPNMDAFARGRGCGQGWMCLWRPGWG